MLAYMELVRLERSLREQPVLSVYLDGTAEDFASQHAWRSHLDTSLKDLRVWLEGFSHTERALFERCVALLETELAPLHHGVGAPGWAAFITGDGVRDAEPLPVPMPTMAVWSTGACVAPYIRALKQTRPVIVVVADARQARLYRYRAGVLDKVKTARAHARVEPPSHMGDPSRFGFHAGVRGATGRDGAQRALLEGTRRLLYRVAEQALKLAGVDGWILVGGIPAVSAKLAQMLAASARTRVLHLEMLEVHASDADIRRAAEGGASALRDAWDLRQIEEIVDQAEQPDSVVALGPAATHLALQGLRVRELYLTHRYVESHMADAEDAVRAAFTQSAVVEELAGPAALQLDALGGMAARLRYRLAAPDAVTGGDGLERFASNDVIAPVAAGT
jgi:hypothetical protein